MPLVTEFNHLHKPGLYQYLAPGGAKRELDNRRIFT